MYSQEEKPSLLHYNYHKWLKFLKEEKNEVSE